MTRQVVNYLAAEIGKRAKLRFHVHPHMLRYSTRYYLANGATAHPWRNTSAPVNRFGVIIWDTIVPANRCGYIKIRALFTYEVPLCVALKSMTN